MAVWARDIGPRAASAVVLAPAAVLAIWAGGLWFLVEKARSRKRSRAGKRR